MTPAERQLIRLLPGWKKDGRGIIPISPLPLTGSMQDGRVVRRFNKQDVEPFPPEIEGNSTFPPPPFPFNCGDYIGANLNYASSGFTPCPCVPLPGPGFGSALVTSHTINTTGVAVWDGSSLWTATVGEIYYDVYTDAFCSTYDFSDSVTVYLEMACSGPIMAAKLGTSPGSNNLWFNNNSSVGVPLSDETPGGSCSNNRLVGDGILEFSL